MKKRMRRGKKPVLTSPWKIGALVSLLLVFMSLGVSFYIVSFYHVAMKWLTINASNWGFDANLFFKEMYPLAAGVILVSLMAYFLVSSAVRRYKYYLDSGQDYRTMISLAESIDDLTNPAQIARLSSYPELQSVLRNYGDQIREISQELGQRDGVADTDELETSIERLLRGDSVEAGPAVSKDFASIYGRIRDYAKSNRTRIADLENRCESERMALGQAALSYGRAMEAMGGAGEEILAISNAAAELDGIADGLRAGAAAFHGTAAETRGAGQGDGFRAIVADMETSVRKLQDGGHALQEFSEENNGIAINLALMASRGTVAEGDLAAFAERVRSTAERFHKLSGTVSSIAQSLLGTCYIIKEKAGASAPAAGIDPGVPEAIARIAQLVEDRSGFLQKHMCGLGSELSDAQELLRKDRPTANAPLPGAESAPAHAEAGESREAPREAQSAAEAEQSGGESSEFIIDHGKAWGGVDSGAGAAQAEGPAESEDAPGAIAAEESEPRKTAESAPHCGDARKKSDYSDMSSLRELDAVETPDDGLLSEKEHGSPGESWMEMPGHQWRKIDIEKPELEDELPGVEVTVEQPQPAAAPAVKVTHGPGGHVPPTTADSNEVRKEETAADSDKIYDLFELGAVEFIEEVQARR